MSPPLTVLSILAVASTRTGGPPAFVGEAARELPAHGVVMRVLSTDLALAPTGYVQRQQRVSDAELHPSLSATDGLSIVPARFPRRLAYSPALRRAARELSAEADVVHLHNLWQHPQYAGAREAIAAGVPYVVSPHGGFDPYLRQHGRLRKRLTSLLWQDAMLERAALIHVTTPAEEELVADIAPEVPRFVVPPGLYVDQFRELPPPGRFRDSHLGGYDGPLVLFLGRLTYKKGLDLLVRSLAHARAETEARLVIAGPDDEGLRPGLERLAAELGIGEHVSFAGPVYGEDRLAALAACDVWALSSHAENFGIAVVEAMAAGCAVVISPGVNISAEIAAADAGVCAGLDPDEFGGALAAVLTDDDRRAQLRAAAAEFADRYDWGQVAPRLAKMYRTAADAAGAKP